MGLLVTVLRTQAAFLNEKRWLPRTFSEEGDLFTAVAQLCVSLRGHILATEPKSERHQAESVLAHAYPEKVYYYNSDLCHKERINSLSFHKRTCMCYKNHLGRQNPTVSALRSQANSVNSQSGHNQLLPLPNTRYMVSINLEPLGSFLSFETRSHASQPSLTRALSTMQSSHMTMAPRPQVQKDKKCPPKLMCCRLVLQAMLRYGELKKWLDDEGL